MFVRVKKIKGRPYAYLVENEWTPWGSRQRVTKYLGKTHFLERLSKEATELPEGLSPAIMEALAQELKNNGFTKLNSRMIKDEIIVDLQEKTIRQKNKKVVLGMNEGYLCDHTLHQLLGFKPLEKPDDSAKKLANFVLEAGLKLNDAQFVHIFEQTKEEDNE
jgi:hypothetical protein